MSLEEMENAWQTQKTNATPPPEAERRISRVKNDFTKTVIICAGVTLTVIFVFGLKVHRILEDSDRTFSNSIWDLTLNSLGVVCVFFSVVYLVRFYRELRALGQDTRRCIELFIRNVEEEIRSIRRDAPVMFLIYLIIIALAKWESIRAGYETPDEWSLLIAVAAMFTIFAAVLYHRLKTFLVPRSVELKNLLRQFDQET